MKKDIRCEYCKFYKTAEYPRFSGGRIDYGQCRRHSPEYGPQAGEGFPKVNETDWCGEFVSRYSED